MKCLLLTVVIIILSCITGVAQESRYQQPPANKYDQQKSQQDTLATTVQQYPIEVLESKEGPMNAVVYQYRGELFYIDREREELVKIDRSQLKESGDQLIIRQGSQ